MSTTQPRGTVLVIDDEESAGRLVRLHFSSWRVVQAYDLSTAATAIAAAADLRLILLDLNLGDTTYPESLLDNPFQGSFALAHQVRRAHPRVPIVIFSADWGTGIASAVQRVGAEFVFKRDCSENLKALRRRLELAPRSGVWTFV